MSYPKPNFRFWAKKKKGIDFTSNENREIVKTQPFQNNKKKCQYTKCRKYLNIICREGT